MKIRSLTLKHIGVFEDETIAFPEKKEKDKAEIHILTGQNGTGKTTILQALAYSVLGTEPFVTYEDVNEGIVVDFGSVFTKKFNDEYSLCKVLLSTNYSIKLDKGYKANSSIKQLRIDVINSEGVNRKEKFRLETPLRIIKPIINFVSFSYSGYRFVNHEEEINIKENESYDPLLNALEFNKKYGEKEYTLNQWLANTISKRNNAFFEGNEKEVERFKRNIENLKLIIQEIIEIPIDFKFKNETSKIVAVKNGIELDFDLLPDGLRSIISWIGDLLMRMDALKWENDLPVFEREFILFLDEIEVHLHPSWQRKVLPVVQKLFKNAQIFITTHSPFIVNSIDGAYIYELKLDADGKCTADEPTISSTSMPIDEVLSEVYDIEPTQMYGELRTKEIEDFQKEVAKAYKKETDFDKKNFLSKAKKLADRSPELRNNVQFELRQLSKSLVEDFSI